MQEFGLRTWVPWNAILWELFYVVRWRHNFINSPNFIWNINSPNFTMKNPMYMCVSTTIFVLFIIWYVNNSPYFIYDFPLIYLTMNQMFQFWSGISLKMISDVDWDKTVNKIIREIQFSIIFLRLNTNFLLSL